MKTKIIYEDADLLVVHKPSGMATQTERMGEIDVVSELKNYIAKSGKTPYIGVIHRLDQPVEGLLVFAKTKGAAANLSKQITTGTLKKFYFALVCGQPEEEEKELTDYLAKGPGNTSIVIENDENQIRRNQAKKAKLSYHCCYTKQLLEVGQNYSLMEIELFTGRHHQIRVQMSHAGMPLLGDRKYGTEASFKLSEAIHIRQTALLAYRLVYKHPKTGKMMEFELPIPSEWQ